MPTASLCPELPQWQRLVLGDLHEEDAEILVAHLAGCLSCSDVMRTLRAEDTLVELLRASGRSTDQPRREQVAGLMERLKRLRLAAASGSNPDVLDLPSPPTGASWPATQAGTTDTAQVRGGCPATEVQERYDFLHPGVTPDELGRLGHYRVLRVLGAGGMGVVFHAEDLQLKRPVALKAMRPALTGGAARQRFLREAQAMAAVKHDHVVTIYQVDQDRDVPFLAMEFLAGETLEDRLKREGKLPPAEVLRLGRETAEALAAAHERGLIHRDIKPANLWLEAPRGRVKVLDFGLARVLQDDAHLTQSGTVIGTPAYMAPEQARGEKVDQRCDLFSLGVVLYRACTGQLPFRGNNTLAILTALATQQPQPVRVLEPAVPSPLAELIMCLLDKSPQARPGSAGEIAQQLLAIERQLAAEPARTEVLPAKPHRSVSPPPIRGRWRRWAVAAVALVALVPLGYFFGGTVVRFAANKGVLVVAVDDPHIEVQVKQSGVIVQDRTTRREFVLAAAAGEIKVYEKDSGLELATKKFTLTRGGKETVRVTVERTKPAPVAIRPPSRPPEKPSGAAVHPHKEAYKEPHKEAHKEPHKEAHKEVHPDARRQGDPQVKAVNPQVKAVKPNITAVRPNITAVRPNITAVRPNITAVRPNITAVKPNITAVKPNITAVNSWAAPREKMVALFNGKDLTGWKVYPRGTGQWAVKNGILVSSGGQSHLFSERGDYRNFHLLAEAKINNKGNSGVFFRAAFGPDPPDGYEAQINATHRDRVKTGSLYPARGVWASNPALHILDKAPHEPDEWFTLEVICKGPKITLLVNRKKTIEWTDPKEKYRKGHFALQQHESGTVVQFRKIEVKELPPS
jgi:hypothetical protein